MSEVITEKNLAPIRKVAVTAVVAAIGIGAKAAGLDVGPELVNDFAVALVALVAGYLVPDPRVVA